MGERVKDGLQTYSDQRSVQMQAYTTILNLLIRHVLKTITNVATWSVEFFSIDDYFDVLMKN